VSAKPFRGADYKNEKAVCERQQGESQTGISNAAADTLREDGVDGKEHRFRKCAHEARLDQ